MNALMSGRSHTEQFRYTLKKFVEFAYVKQEKKIF